MASNYEPMDTASQALSKDEDDLRRKVQSQGDDADLKWLMKDKRGRRIVWRQLGLASVFRLSFNTNAMAMSFAEGERNYGLRLLNRINTLCPEFYVLMVEEQKDGRK